MRVVDGRADGHGFGRHLTGQEPGDGLRRAAPFGHGGDDDPRPERDIAAGEHIGPGSGQRLRVGFNRAARSNFEVVLGAHPGQIRRLADGEDDPVGGDRFLGALKKGGIETPVLIEDRGDLDQFNAGNLSVLSQNAFRSPACVQLHAFFDGNVNLGFRRRHLLQAFEAIHVDFAHPGAQRLPGDVECHFQILRAFLLSPGELIEGRRGLAQNLAHCFRTHVVNLARLPHDRARDIEGHIAAANHDHLAVQIDLVAEVDVEQIVNRAKRAVQVHAFDVQLAALVRADGEEDRLEAILFETGQGEIAAEPAVQFDLHSQVNDRLNLRLNDFARQAVLRNAQRQHPARHALGLEDGRLESHQGEVVRAAQARRASPDHGDPATVAQLGALSSLGGRINLVEIEAFRFHAVLFANESFQRADGDGGIDVFAPAFRLAGRGAHAPANGGKRIGPASDDVGVLVPPVGDRLNVAASIRPNRTPRTTEHLPLKISYIRNRDIVRLRHFSSTTRDPSEWLALYCKRLCTSWQPKIHQTLRLITSSTCAHRQPAP